MRTDAIFGWGLFFVGFLGAAATACPKPRLWPVFSIALVVSMVGALIARGAARKQAMESSTATLSIDGKEQTREALPLLEFMAERLSTMTPLDDPDATKEAIEALQYSLIAPFVAERRRYLAEFGPVVFAHFFSSFARAERGINRSWSAIVDCHPKEASASIATAQQALGEAVQVLHDEAGI